MGNSRPVWPLGLGIVLLAALPAGREAGPSSVRQKPVVRAAQPERLHLYQVGQASWYGEPFHGRLTASGETFDMFLLTAAHRDLPLGARVRVTHLRSRRSVVVRINDRGPFLAHNIIDLSYGAARKLGVVEQGLSRVRLEVMKNSGALREESSQANGGGPRSCLRVPAFPPNPGRQERGG